MTTAVPPRVAADRAAAATREVATAASVIVTSALEAAMGSMEAKLAAAYEEAYEHRDDAVRYHEHAEADHAALERIGGQLRSWRTAIDRPGMDPAMRGTLGAVCDRIQAAIDGTGDGDGQDETGTGPGTAGA